MHVMWMCMLRDVGWRSETQSCFGS